ncbi:ROK family transcriptional regulator [Actinoallomurus sp. NPDC052308]|uniref:ROK family transcriptional regulator n=1 Tax=Actinoallomurus sp. NPDC052308 TaxID=3155530 RepID=UPI003429CE89
MNAATRQGSPLVRLRRGHQELVLGLLRAHGPLSRGELGKRCGLSRTTLYDILAGLLADGVVVTREAGPGIGADATPRRRGRPAETLALNPAAGQAIGIDFARRAVHVAAVNVAHEIVGSAGEPHPADLPWPERVTIAARLIGTLTGGPLRLSTLTAMGVGIVGPVVGPPDETAGSPPLENLLRERFGMPVLVDNNTRLAALAESIWGAAADHQDVLYLRLSHGVGGGLVTGGSLHRGAYGLSGEFGHIPVHPADGARCECGGVGCLETVASVNAVLATYRAAGGQAEDLPDLAAAVQAGDTLALGVLREVGALIGTVLAGLSNAIGPEVIVVGGELTRLGAPLIEPIEEALAAHVMRISRHRVGLRRATLGDAGGALGGIALVLHESPLLSRYPAEPDPEERPMNHSRRP